MKLELVVVGVTDVDRARAFYSAALGFAVDVDVAPAEGRPGREHVHAAGDAMAHR